MRTAGGVIAFFLWLCCGGTPAWATDPAPSISYYCLGSNGTACDVDATHYTAGAAATALSAYCVAQSDTVTGSGAPASVGSGNPTNGLVNSHCQFHAVYIVAWGITCPVDWTPGLSSGAFVCTQTVGATCAGNVGKVVDFGGDTSASAAGSLDQYTDAGSAGRYKSDGACVSGCLVQVQTAACTHVTASCYAGLPGCGPSGGPADIETCAGSGTITATVCGVDAHHSTSLAVKGTRASGQGAAVAGGKGTAPNNTSGAITTSDINLGKIATNTSDILDKLNSGISTSGGGSSGPVALDATATGKLDAIKSSADAVHSGQCGGTGQPACKLNEGDTGTTAGAMLDSLDSARGEAGTALDSVGTTLTSAVPSFVAPGGHWMPSFTSILPAASCSMPLTISLPGYSPMSWTLSVCGWGGYARDILGMICYVLATLFVWLTLFKGRS